jgi:hypothetical protein
MHQWMDDLAAANPSWVSTEVIGQSYLGNDVKVLRLNTANSSKKFWIDGGTSIKSLCLEIFNEHT